MKKYDEKHVNFKNHTIYIPRKMQILRFFNLSNFFTDITTKNKGETQNIVENMYMGRKKWS